MDNLKYVYYLFIIATLLKLLGLLQGTKVQSIYIIFKMCIIYPPDLKGH